MNGALSGEEGMIAGAILGIIGIIFLGILAVQVFVCWLLYDALGAVPQQHRKQEPGLVWLMLIPCFNLIWGFFVYPKIARSFAEALQARGIGGQGDAGESLGMWVAIVAVLNCVPYLNFLALIAYFVLMIIYLVKIRSLKKLLLGAV